MSGSFDTLVASSVNDQPAVGPSPRLLHGDLGARLLLRLRELDERLQIDVDYRGRIPYAGVFRNSKLSLLYRAEASYTTNDERWRVGLGRFVARVPTFLPVDGGRVRYTNDGFRAEVFAGRRAITTSRTNVAFSTFLPAVGASFGWGDKRIRTDVVAAWSQDTFLHVGSPDEPSRVGGLSGTARASFAPRDTVRFGGQLSLHQQAKYLLGPTWNDSVVEVEAPQLFHAIGWLSATPSERVRIDLDLLHQAAAVFAAGTFDETSRVEDLAPTTFSDARVRVRLGTTAGKGWLRPMARVRIRPDRQEIRLGLQAEWNDVILPGLYLEARGMFDDILGDEQAQNVGRFDRTYGRAALGVRKGGFDAQGGASFVERSLTPSSGRQGSAGQPDAHEDLHPFVLEADPIVFGRAFYSRRRWFTGVDVEKHLREPEVRVLVQVGVNTGVSW